MKIEEPLGTPLGLLFLVVTEAAHIFAGFDRDNVFTVRGVNYHGSAHLYKWTDGRFHIGQEFKDEYGKQVPTTPYDRRVSLHVTRCDWDGSNRTEPSQSARDKMFATIETCVNAWVEKNAAALNIAEGQHLHEQVEAAEKELSEALEAARVARVALEVKQAAYSEHLRRCLSLPSVSVYA